MIDLAGYQTGPDSVSGIVLRGGGWGGEWGGGGGRERYIRKPGVLLRPL